MIGIDDAAWSKLQAQKKGMEYLIIFMALILAVLLWFMLSAPNMYCQNWGGVLYSDGSCHIVEDLSMCLTPEGSIKHAPGEILINESWVIQ